MENFWFFVLSTESIEHVTLIRLKCSTGRNSETEDDAHKIIKLNSCDLAIRKMRDNFSRCQFLSAFVWLGERRATGWAAMSVWKINSENESCNGIAWDLTIIISSFFFAAISMFALPTSICLDWIYVCRTLVQRLTNRIPLYGWPNKQTSPPIQCPSSASPRAQIHTPKQLLRQRWQTKPPNHHTLQCHCIGTNIELMFVSHKFIN